MVSILSRSQYMNDVCLALCVSPNDKSPISIICRHICHRSIFAYRVTKNINCNSIIIVLRFFKNPTRRFNSFNGLIRSVHKWDNYSKANPPNTSEYSHTALFVPCNLMHTGDKLDKGYMALMKNLRKETEQSIIFRFYLMSKLMTCQLHAGAKQSMLKLDN